MEDQPLMREALRLYVDSTEDLSLAGEAGDSETAVRDVLAIEPDVVVMDIDLLGKNGIHTAQELLDSMPALAILMVTTFTTDHHVVRPLRAGARGYITKDTPA
ncbi:response regulator [Nesterenkonia populi]|uniref:response regulator n=1 Tax=Nesterenkonia populi TaxID=1591087 RepID=UPI00147864A8|nr:response regulator transcription factor [Nesterenkonia populi]